MATRRRRRSSSPRGPAGDPRRQHASASHRGRRRDRVRRAERRSAQLLRALVEVLCRRTCPPRSARAWLDEIRQAGPDGVEFAWAARPTARQPHAYRVQGPTFLIEFNNTQNGANHIHCVWRNMLGDFGIPLAAK